MLVEPETPGPRPTPREVALIELRLIDPYGATVPGTQYSRVPAANVPELTDRLRNEVAPAHAAEHDGINGYRFHATDYWVQETPEPTVAARGTFLDLLATPTAA